MIKNVLASGIMGFASCIALLSASAQEMTASAVALPPDADKATAQLAASPRHGEWVKVPMPDSEVKINSFVAYPERADKAPAVIVIHEIFGMTDWVRGVADQLAAEGFIAIAPDLLSGMGPDGGGSESLGENVRQTISNLDDAQKVARLNAVFSYVAELPSCTGKVGSIGFCWGGGTSFLYASEQPKLGAAVVYYGTAPTSEEQLAKIKAPVLGMYGGNDDRVDSTVRPSEKSPGTLAQMEKLDKSYETHFYEGAGHAFLRQIAGNEANLKGAEQAWPRTLEFLRTHLEKKESAG